MSVEIVSGLWKCFYINQSPEQRFCMQVNGAFNSVTLRHLLLNCCFDNDGESNITKYNNVKAVGYVALGGSCF